VPFTLFLTGHPKTHRETALRCRWVALLARPARPLLTPPPGPQGRAFLSEQGQQCRLSESRRKASRGEGANPHLGSNLQHRLETTSKANLECIPINASNVRWNGVEGTKKPLLSGALDEAFEGAP
jgi:hypothetical protein